MVSVATSHSDLILPKRIVDLTDSEVVHVVDGEGSARSCEMVFFVITLAKDIATFALSLAN